MSGVVMRCLDALAFSSILVASIAAALTLAAALSLVTNSSAGQLAAALAFAGTLVVYNVDRLRDLERDRRSWPRRSAFVSRHRRPLSGLIILAAGAAAVLGWRAGPAAVGLCGAVLVPALFHRRIKQHSVIKTGYVTVAWVAVLVGLPVLSMVSSFPPLPILLAPSATTPLPTLMGSLDIPHAGRLALIACVYGAAIGANLIASNARAGNRPSMRALWGARGLAAVGVLTALAAPSPLRALACVPLAQLASLIGFRGGERARLLLVDGALLLGALGVLALRTLG